MRQMVVGLFCVLCLVAALAASAVAWRASEHAAYHRSKAAEYEMLSRILLTFPLGTRLEVFSQRLGLSPEDQVQRDGLIEVRIRPTLEIEESETRSYAGFSFSFRDGALVDAEPVGPDAPGRTLDVSASLKPPQVR